MKDLSDFVKNEFNKRQLFEQYNYIDTIEGVDEAVSTLNFISNMSIRFKSTNLKEYFFDKITTARPEVTIINCNCSLNTYYENNFDKKLIIFNNLGKCKYQEIFEDIKKYKSIKIC